MRTRFGTRRNPTYSAPRPPDMPRLAAIVCGDGETEALPILIRRIARELDPQLVPRIHPVLRVQESKLVRPGELERSVELAARKLGGDGGIFVLMDCDDGCPATDGPALLRRATDARPNMPVTVVLAKREFETWFLAAAGSLGGRRGLPAGLRPPANPEAIRGAKEWLTRQMAGTGSYSPTTDQPALAEVFELNAARSSDSFDKCYREIERMLRSIQ